MESLPDMDLRRFGNVEATLSCNAYTYGKRPPSQFPYTSKSESEHSNRSLGNPASIRVSSKSDIAQFRCNSLGQPRHLILAPSP